MNNRHRLLAGSLLLVFAGAAMLALGLTAPANSPEQGVTAQPRIATVRMGEVLARLNETGAIKTAMQQMGIAVVQEHETRTARAQEMLDSLEAFPAGSDKRRELESELMMESATLKIWLQVKEQELALEESLRFQELYRNIIAEVDAMAAAQGYDFVMLNDARTDFAPGSSPGDVLNQIANRTMLRVDPASDVTEELVTRMNVAFNAGLGG